MPDQEKPLEFENKELTPTEELEAASSEDIEEEPQAAEATVCAPANKCVMRAAAVSIAIVCFVAVLVAGFVQLGARWREPAPKAAPVSGPAGALWHDMNSTNLSDHPLGAPENLRNEVGFKSGAAPKASQ
jgi:hypothetical protein